MPNEDNTFDVSEFLGSAAPSGGMSTEIAQPSEGTYKLQITTPDRWTGKVLDSNDGGPARKIVRILFEVLDDAVRAQLEREHVYVPKDFWLDFDETGQLSTSKGKNVDLGRLRTALGQNTDPSWTMAKLADQLVLGRVGLRADKKDPSRKYAEVQTFAPVA